MIGKGSGMASLEVLGTNNLVGFYRGNDHEKNCKLR